MKTKEELNKMSLLELNAELKKAIDALEKDLIALGVIREVAK